MKIKVGLNKRSIGNAIKRLQKAQKDLEGQMYKDFLNGCAEWFITRANEYVMLSDIGYNVKSGITAEWQVDLQDNKVVITNSHDKAVYVEFGVGLVGASNPHENAIEAGYEYDLIGAKDPNGVWQFITTEDDLDLPQKALLYREENGSDILVRTKGVVGVAYAYNALVDLHDIGAKEIWNNVKKKYWR